MLGVLECFLENMNWGFCAELGQCLGGGGGARWVVESSCKVGPVLLVGPGTHRCKPGV